jgi:hypothetical protein
VIELRPYQHDALNALALRGARLTRHRTAIRTAVIVGHRAIEDARQHALGNLPVAGPGGNVELKCSETP